MQTSPPRQCSYALMIVWAPQNGQPGYQGATFQRPRTISEGRARPSFGRLRWRALRTNQLIFSKRDYKFSSALAAASACSQRLGVISQSWPFEIRPFKLGPTPRAEPDARERYSCDAFTTDLLGRLHYGFLRDCEPRSAARSIRVLTRPLRRRVVGAVPACCRCSCLRRR
jgi:hypothetical protein